jgi:carbamoyltransferase
MATEMDALVVGNYLMLKQDQPESARRSSEQYLNELEPD